MPLLKWQMPKPDEAHAGQCGYRVPETGEKAITRKASVELTCPAQEPLGPRRVCSEPEVWASWGGVPEADSSVKWDCGP